MANLKNSRKLQAKQKTYLSHELQEAGKLGLFEVSPDRNLFTASESCFTLLGLNPSAGSIEMTRFLNLIYKKDQREKVHKFMIAPVLEAGYFETDFRIRVFHTGNKEVRIIRMIITPDRERNFVLSGILRDITSEKKIERELLRAKNRAEKADRFKAIFLTNLSHELRTPMNAILGFAELLKGEQQNSDHMNEYLSIIRNKADYLLSLVDDVIELSRLETGDIMISKTSFRIKPFMMDLYNEFLKRRTEKDKGHVELDLDLPDQISNRKIFTDPGRLHQVLVSILSNAFKFTDKGKVRFGFRMSAKNYKFFVSDTGIGLDSDDQRRIFNRFEEIEETTLTKLGGTGLSLTIAKKIIDQLGGKIRVKSELNKGSFFQVSIPIENPPKKKTDMSTETVNIGDINWKDKVILIAEDEELNFRFLEAIMQKTQAKVLRARNGAEAVELCKNISHIDLILMDIKMPVMSGNEATEEIKKKRPGLPVIAQTAFSVREEIEKCKEAGCDDFVTKPINIRTLLVKMLQLFQK